MFDQMAVMNGTIERVRCGWCRGRMGGPDGPVCVLGGVTYTLLTMGGGDVSLSHARPVLDAMMRTIRRSSAEHDCSRYAMAPVFGPFSASRTIQAWNDAPRRTHADVMEMLYCAKLRLMDELRGQTEAPPRPTPQPAPPPPSDPEDGEKAAVRELAAV